MQKIYLSGGVQFTNDWGIEWREKVCEDLIPHGYVGISPVKMNKEYEDEWLKQYHIKTSKIAFRQNILNVDLTLLLEYCDMVLLLYNDSVKQGAGSISECQTAYSNNIPVYTINDTDKPLPTWLNALSQCVFDDFAQFYTYLNRKSANTCSNCGINIKVDDIYCSECQELLENTKQHDKNINTIEKYIRLQEQKVNQYNKSNKN